MGAATIEVPIDVTVTQSGGNPAMQLTLEAIHNLGAGGKFLGLQNAPNLESKSTRLGEGIP